VSKHFQSEFDRQFNRTNKIVSVMFAVAVLFILSLFSFCGYLAFRFGPKALNLIDKGLNTAVKGLDKTDDFLSE
jgi:hypothetical protein